mgnify:CR=1 FL=1
MVTETLFENDARTRLVSGVQKLARAVTTTLGPKGRNVCLMTDDTPVVTHDGVTVAKEIHLKDRYENVGAQLVKEAAVKTNSVVGDGTTTSILLANSMVQHGHKIISSGRNAMLVRQGILSASKIVVDELTKMSKPVNTKTDITYVASVSSQNKELGEKISDAFEKVGEGNVLVTESKGNYVDIKYLEGLRFEKGYVSPYFVNQEETSTCELSEPLILIAEDKIMNLQAIVPLLEEMFKQGKHSLLIVTDQLSDAVVGPLVLNKMSGNLDICVVEPPSFGNTRKAMLRDIATVTGSAVVCKMEGKTFDSLTLEDLGSCEKVIVKSNSTVILNGSGDQKNVYERLATVKKQLEELDSEHEKSNLKERINLLTGGVAEIAVGAATETELKEKKMLVEDAVNAVTAAQKGGIVPGGGISYLLVVDSLKRAMESIDDEEVRMGYDVVLQSLYEPLKHICKNGGVNGDIILNNVLEKQKENKHMGYNIMNNTYVNMMVEGIIDPALVLCNAIQNAASVTSNILTTEAVVVKEEEK